MVDGIRGPSQFDLPEFVSLQREVDPELRGEGLISLAARLVRDGRFELAAPLYDQLHQDTAFPASIRERARVRLAALRGQGDLGARAELVLGNLVQQASDPSTLFAMTLAGVAFRATQFASLARFAASPSATLSRGWVPRALAGLLGFGVEATAFPLAARLGSAALGRESEWSFRSLGHETASSFLMLGALRAGGLITGSLASRGGIFRPLIQQAGMFGGIVLGHELEVQANLRQRRSGTTALLDSLSTLLQFNVAGRLSRNLFGEGLRNWESRIESQSRALSRNPSPFRWPELSSNLAFAGPFRGSRIDREALEESLVYMQGSDGEGGPSRPRGGKVLSMSEFRERAGRPLPIKAAEKPTVAPLSLVEQFARASTPEYWLEQIEAAMMLWVAETPVNPRVEFNFLRNRLIAHPPELTTALGYLSIQRPVAAQLLALRLDLVRENSWLRLSPKIQAAAEESFASRYPDSVERQEILAESFQRFLDAVKSPGVAPHRINLNLDNSQKALDQMPAELAEAWRDSLLSDEQFLALSRALEIFSHP